METATRNPDSADPLPLFRPEALAARQNSHGEVLSIRPFSWVFLCCVGVSIAAGALAFLLLAHYTPTAKALGEISSAQGMEAAPNQRSLEATFYIDGARDFRIQTGTRVLLRCSGCRQSFAIGGTVTGVDEMRPYVDTTATSLARPGPVHKVTVALPVASSPLASRSRFTPGATLEAEFPLARRPLIHWLIGPAVF